MLQQAIDEVDAEKMNREMKLLRPCCTDAIDVLKGKKQSFELMECDRCV